MTTSVVSDPDAWQETNWHDLMAAVASVRQSLEQYIAQWDTSPASHQPVYASQFGSITFTSNGSGSSALQQLCTIFGLTDFEREVLLLCVGVELDPVISTLCATIQGDRQGSPTFSIALSVFAQPHWSAIAPQRPLRRWQLIEVGSGPALTLSPLRVDERILHYLTGVSEAEGRIVGLIKPVTTVDELVPSHQHIAQQIAAIWLQNTSFAALPIVQLCGDDAAGKRAIATVACHLSNKRLSSLSAQAIPTQTSDLDTLMVLWEREVILNRTALLLDCDGLDNTNSAQEASITQWIEEIHSPLIVTQRDRRRVGQRPLITFDVALPTKAEQRHLWQEALSHTAFQLNGQVEELVAQFNLNAPTIRAVCVEAIGKSSESGWVSAWDTKTADSATDPPPIHPPSHPPPPPTHSLWDICRTQARPRLDDLAQRIIPSATWEDLVLPEREYQVLRGIAAHVRQRITVYEDWGFAAKGQRGLGISALFAGASGTGKTMSAEVLAQELRLDLYRIDLSSVVSKYIGETEKNLRRVFDAAEAGATILLFDEADALFGKRSEVKDSHDRYANMEVSYLLQRMEAYQGLAILTTNMKESIDTAFLRRIRFIVKFPFPDFAQRVEIWRRIFPKATPTQDLDATKLAKLNVAGGNIRNIALHAAFLAADDGKPIQMKHLLEATWSEYIKMERTLTDAEVRGWI
jgi:hypothetical protein